MPTSAERTCSALALACAFAAVGLVREPGRARPASGRCSTPATSAGSPASRFACRSAASRCASSAAACALAASCAAPAATRDRCDAWICAPAATAWARAAASRASASASCACGIGAVEPDEEVALRTRCALADRHLEDPGADARGEVHGGPLDLARAAGRRGERPGLPPEPERDEAGEDDDEDCEDDEDAAHRNAPAPRRAGPPSREAQACVPARAARAPARARLRFSRGAPARAVRRSDGPFGPPHGRAARRGATRAPEPRVIAGRAAGTGLAPRGRGRDVAREEAMVSFGAAAMILVAASGRARPRPARSPDRDRRPDASTRRPPPAELTLDAALAELDRQNLALAQARSRAEEAAPPRGRSAAQLVPSLSAQASYARNSDDAGLSIGPPARAGRALGASSSRSSSSARGARCASRSSSRPPGSTSRAARSAARAADASAEAVRLQLRAGLRAGGARRARGRGGGRRVRARRSRARPSTRGAPIAA